MPGLSGHNKTAVPCKPSTWNYFTVTSVTQVRDEESAGLSLPVTTICLPTVSDIGSRYDTDAMADGLTAILGFLPQHR
jgi:hypothetical protein